MNNLLVYLIQVTSVFSVLYFVYILFFNRLTFHTINRRILILLLPVSILLPILSNLFPVLSSKIIEVPLFEYIVNSQNHQVFDSNQKELASSFLNFNSVLIIIYFLIVIVYLIRILVNTKSIFNLKNKSIIQKEGGYKIAFADVPEIFSYFKWIFIPKKEFKKYNQQIVEHEIIHIKLKHSWDVILSELYLSFFWFNPLLYFYRKSLKSIHEFQADKGVLEKGIKTSQYMELLLQSLKIQKPNNLYNYFNQPILKKRITMMTKPKSKNLSKLTYIVLFPVFTILTLAFTKPSSTNDSFIKTINISNLVSSPPSLFPVKNASKKDITSLFGKFRKNPIIKKKVVHGGIDIKASIGTPVIATADGIINKASLENAWGNLIIITHANGYETWYAHLNDFNVIKNQKVKKGDIIGFVGNTGRSLGPHLHYEVKQNGKRLNPLNFIK
ncbi:M23/M56 family metallopeptidase [Tenacibaculum halocynthiae]|uniref:M23/M56 family metallopeptidase n=1 Tax=Tenacibaculum halocynthiae TaxID=1254437 RepID=UPI003D64F3C6